MAARLDRDAAYQAKTNIYTHSKAIHMVWDGQRWRNLPLMICRGDPDGITLALVILLPSAQPAEIPYFPLAENPTVANFIHCHSVVADLEQSETVETLDQIIRREIEEIDDAAVYLDKITAQHEEIYGYEIGPDKFNPRMSNWLNGVRRGQIQLANQYYQTIFSNIVNEIRNDKETYFKRAFSLCKMLTKTIVTRGFLHAAQILKSHCLAMRRQFDDADFGAEDVKKYFFDERNLPLIGANIGDYMRGYVAPQRQQRRNIPNADLEAADAVAVAGFEQYQRTRRMMGDINDPAGRTVAIPRAAVANRARAERNRQAIALVQLERQDLADEEEARRRNERNNIKWTPPGFAYSADDNYVVYYNDQNNRIQHGHAGLNEVILPRTAHIDQLNIGGVQINFPQAGDDRNAEVWAQRNPGWKYTVRF